VNIFIDGRKGKHAPVDFAFDRFQPVDNFAGVARWNDTLAREHFGVSNAPGDIVAIKPPVDINGRGKGLH
jgi:hypothetical protein